MNLIQYLQQSSSNHMLYFKFSPKLQLTKYYIFYTFKLLYIYVCIPGVSFYPNFHVTRLINSWQTCHYCTVLESIDIMTTDNILQHGLDYTILSPSSTIRHLDSPNSDKFNSNKSLILFGCIKTYDCRHPLIQDPNYHFFQSVGYFLR